MGYHLSENTVLSTSGLLTGKWQKEENSRDHITMIHPEAAGMFVGKVTANCGKQRDHGQRLNMKCSFFLILNGNFCNE